MSALRDFFGGFGDLFSTGALFWLLFLLAVFLWALIIERFWYFYGVHPGVVEVAMRRWKRWSGAKSALAQRARLQILANVSAETHRAISLIDNLVWVIMLTGLLAGVSGVMRVLQSLSSPGAAGEQLFAAGLDRAVIPAITAGAVVLVALFVTKLLRDRADNETRLLADRLRRG
ncbi:MAG TPA: MotA/TolQ/ExbB proton channel family protein [Gammaproteobacteria bacterium]|nr:MotA/TolQ/ExbB proton channel family protein [Gammaproteobacteria bacterium]